MIRFLSFKEIDGVLDKKKKEFGSFFLSSALKKESSFFKKKKPSLLSSKLEKDIANDKIYYKDNYFYGTINKSTLRAIKKLGAVYDNDKNGYYLPKDKLPSNLLKKINKSNDQYDSFVIFIKQQVEKNINGIKDTKIIQVVLQDYTDIFNKIKKTFGEEADRDVFKDEIEERTKKGISQLKKDVLDYFLIKLNDDKKRKFNPLTFEKQIEDGVFYRCGTFIDYIYRDVLISFQKKMCNLNDANKFYWLDINYLSGNKNYRKTHGEFTKQSIEGKLFDMNNPPIDEQTGNSVLPSEEPNCSCIAVVDRQQFLKLVAKYKKNTS